MNWILFLSDIENAIEIGDYNKDLEKYKTLSNECKDLIDKLMTVDIFQRYTIDQALDHDWFKTDPNNNWMNNSRM